MGTVHSTCSRTRRLRHGHILPLCETIHSQQGIFVPGAHESPKRPVSLAPGIPIGSLGPHNGRCPIHDALPHMLAMPLKTICWIQQYVEFQMFQTILHSYSCSLLNNRHFLCDDTWHISCNRACEARCLWTSIIPKFDGNLKLMVETTLSQQFLESFAET